MLCYYNFNLLTIILGDERHWIWLHSGVEITEFFWGPQFKENTEYFDECGLLVFDFDNFWWQVTSCLVQEDQETTIGIICQKDFDAAISLPPIKTEDTIVAASDNLGTISSENATAAAIAAGTSAPGNAALSNCPEGWQAFQGHCYMLSSGGFGWDDAETDCRSRASHLVSVHSKDENDFVVSLYPYSYWMGGTDVEAQVKWK